METKFKVGDKVRVRSLEWYNNNKNIDGEIIAKGGNKFGVFRKYMCPWCGDVIKINSVINGSYRANNGWFWYDWMLEDEPVTEEKQEVKQINKNNMEKTKMTLKEAQEIVKNTKYIVWSEYESRVLQEKLFEIGCKWKISGINICHTDSPFLFVDDNFEISFAPKKDYKAFEKSYYHYMHIDCIISIEIENTKEEQKPKFDPGTLQPFDKVLVREDDDDKWRCSLFSHSCNGTKCIYVCTAHNWEKCIPYNEDTKHLVGTKEEAPEFYQV